MNYAINYVSGNLGINPASLQITANGLAKTYDGLSFFGGNGVTYSGFVPGENSSVLDGTLTYTGNSQGAKNVGNYLITPTGQTAMNYAINYVSGNLGINPASLTLVAVTDSKIYDGNTLSYKIPIHFGLMSGDSLSPLSQSFDNKEVGKRILNVNPSYAIYDGNGGNNYLVDTWSANGVILPKPIPEVTVYPTQEIEPKFGLRYTINPSGNNPVSGEVVADVGGEQEGEEGGRELGSLRSLSNLALQAIGQTLSTGDFRAVGPQRILRRLILRSSNPLRTLKYTREYGFDPLDTTMIAYDINKEFNKEPTEIKLDVGRLNDGITRYEDIPSWTIEVSDSGIPILTKR